MKIKYEFSFMTSLGIIYINKKNNKKKIIRTPKKKEKFSTTRFKKKFS
jgi:hypothetical protein